MLSLFQTIDKSAGLDFASAIPTFRCRTGQFCAGSRLADGHTKVMDTLMIGPHIASCVLSNRAWTAAVALIVCSAAVWGQANVSAPMDPAALLQKNVDLKSQLASSPFRRPLVLESAESLYRVDGTVYAVLDSSFAAVSRTFKSPEQWCEIMILHINTKYCRPDGNIAPTRFQVSIGKKTPQQLSDAFALDFGYEITSDSSSYLSVLLSAPKGPLGTSNYKIEVQAVPLPDNRTFMRLHYAYGYGVTSRVAMLGYLATIGAGKVGFTQLDDGQKTAYIGGMRGAAERNIMRYYLAIEAYQASLARPVDERLESRLKHWFDATEEYSRQLREVDKASYLSMKKDEHKRQQAAQIQN